jgi:hypothetical protein
MIEEFLNFNENISIFENSKLLSIHKGHIHREKEKNPYKLWKDPKGTYVQMFTKHGSFFFDFDDFYYLTKLDQISKVRNITWNLDKKSRQLNKEVYYIRARIGKEFIYLHQYIMNHYGNGCKGITIDHIDRNPINNRRYNLRLASKYIQNSNTDKHTRRRSATPLPEDFNDIKVPKYIGITRFNRNDKYNYVCVIRLHPAQKIEYGEKTWWESSKSSKITLIEKFNSSIIKLKQLNDKLSMQHIQIAGTP